MYRDTQYTYTLLRYYIITNYWEGGSRTTCLQMLQMLQYYITFIQIDRLIIKQTKRIKEWRQ